MRVLICDICGEQIEVKDNDRETEEKRIKAFPNGYFTLEFNPIVLTDKKEPSHFGYREFNTCDMCHAMINRSIFETAKKIRESMYHPTAIVSVGPFPPEPVVMPRPVCTCDLTERG